MRSFRLAYIYSTSALPRPHGVPRRFLVAGGSCFAFVFHGLETPLPRKRSEDSWIFSPGNPFQRGCRPITTMKVVHPKPKSASKQTRRCGASASSLPLKNVLLLPSAICQFNCFYSSARSPAGCGAVLVGPSEFRPDLGGVDLRLGSPRELRHRRGRSESRGHGVRQQSHRCDLGYFHSASRATCRTRDTFAWFHHQQCPHVSLESCVGCRKRGIMVLLGSWVARAFLFYVHSFSVSIAWAFIIPLVFAAPRRFIHTFCPLIYPHVFVTCPAATAQSLPLLPS